MKIPKNSQSITKQFIEASLTKKRDGLDFMRIKLFDLHNLI